MSNHDIRATVIRVLETETGYDLARLDPDSDLRAQVDIDSMRYVAISVAIENALGIELPIEVMRVRTFNEFMAMVEAEVARILAPL
ncbi:MAG TPA: phosphopantetheine-binding protein [Phycisphaerae bacterium]|nr:phosphopantetheine-binding protein [Phycisphaerae bacterium]HRY68078.1 phosphopantetheine-binding protein [Phycisphaerae bacterium]HSA29046.1 phosphopantetheine-binding protein [Phycisphaerae bacterium]